MIACDETKRIWNTKNDGWEGGKTRACLLWWCASVSTACLICVSTQVTEMPSKPAMSRDGQRAQEKQPITAGGRVRPTKWPQRLFQSEKFRRFFEIFSFLFFLLRAAVRLELTYPCCSNSLSKPMEEAGRGGSGEGDVTILFILARCACFHSKRQSCHRRTELHIGPLPAIVLPRVF